MAFVDQYGSYNVEGSLNEHFRVNLTANGIPAWMPSARIVWDHPETPIISGYSGHAFSVTHLGADPIGEYQGRNVGAGERGTTMQGVMAINCWVSKEQAGASYTQRLRQMGDMVTHLYGSARAVTITDVYASTTNPTNLSAVVRLRPPQETPVVADPNPDIMRRRFLVSYNWVHRVTA